MLWAILAVLVAAVLAPLLRLFPPRSVGPVAALLPLGLAAWFATWLGPVASGAVETQSYAWAPSLGISLAFRLDGLALLFALLVTGIGALVALYAGAYFTDRSRVGRFYALFYLFMGAMLGLVLADNLFLLYVFWELTTIASYLLIGFEHEHRASRDGAGQALLVTAAGGLALLLGFVLLGGAGGAQELSALDGAAVRAHDLYRPILLLVLFGCFAKSAQFPFHFWLPSAMAAPTPVSAYLHSATMVKAGVYLLARLHPVLGGTEDWLAIVTTVGAVTMAVGAILAPWQSDLKRLLAYTTVSALGMMVLLLGLGGEAAIRAALAFLLAHALYKGALFLLAGAVEHETGTRDPDRLGGLLRCMPLTAAASFLAAASMAGLPPFAGFVGKEALYEAAQHGPVAPVVLTAVVLANVLYVAAAVRAGAQPFLGSRRARSQAAREGSQPSEGPHEAPWALWLPPLVLGLGGLAAGILTPAVGEALVAPGVEAAVERTVAPELALWHGVNLAFVLGMATIAAALLLHGARGRLGPAVRRLSPLGRFGPERGYDLLVNGLLALAKALTDVLQNGYLRRYVTVTVLTAAALAAWALTSQGAVGWPADLGTIRSYEPIGAVLVLGAGVGAAAARSVLVAVIAVGVVGLGLAFVFLLFGAPDLAMTQVLVDTMAVLLLVLAFRRIPEFVRLSRPVTRALHALVALAGGAVVTFLLVAVDAAGGSSRLAPFFARASEPLAHARNVVNAILVDFRALDTLGEITVLSLSALGVYALLKLGAGERRAQPGSAGAGFGRAPFTVAVGARGLLPLLLLLSLFLLLRGHDRPGGGFLGGVTAAAAFALVIIGQGPAAVRRTLRVHPHRLTGVGLLAAAGSGAVSLVLARPFLTGLSTTIGGVRISTPLVFDIGVYLVVIGVTMAVILALAEE